MSREIRLSQQGCGFIRRSLRCFLLLLIVLLGLASLMSAQVLPCITGALPTGDATYPQQLVQICIPPVGWNGQLVVYAHGFVQPQLPLALPAAELNLIGGNATLAVLLSNGFAFATTSFSKNGYAVEQAARDIDDLVTYFKTLVAPGSLRKTLLVGGSEGGLIATMLLELYPGSYDGALVLCAPIGGAHYQTKYLGDFRVVFDYFFPSVFRDDFKAFEVPETAFLNWGDLNSGYVQKILSSIALNPDKASQLFKVTRVALDPGNLATSAAEASVNLLGYSIFGTPDLIATASGIPFDNRWTLYLGSNNDFALNRGVERVASDPEARAYLRHFYQPTGRLSRPLVSMHTTLDPLVPFNHEVIYYGLATLAGRRNFLTVLPVPSYGHCNFQAAQVLGAFGLLVQQVNETASPELGRFVSSVPAPMN
jgi:pimeloyl-ACP methyl ester carboxylesterase